ncbi:MULTISPECIES: LysR substrate-binding domain-containing protein [unclassified Beijerinckia]|uniref:LysR family transcriptional regulator n=1 Tax=unclassified Beijerinckia TaxID=2638183 RepID=UPI000896650D|nr:MULTISPECIES: LysR substrate-binding domain-containing protein [unclassified Beijerinckia]MDH7798965.1 LysR family nitrogen assimilation transcriptional regulator [Beijerinckia sp. GAS462]SED85730.1 LysR family transcriptional regulator, nitrogen assimilation regulatory protein [Beijerinckia sp. 28-YEA-48]
MDLRSLRYFVYIAEARSFSRASTLLRIAQPALSRQIRKLETELNAELFLRTGRHLELTEAGSMLLQRAHFLLQQAQQAADDIRSQAHQISGTVTIGLSPASYEMIAPLAIAACATRHPHIRINLVEGFSAFIYDKLLQHELDLCLLHNPPAQQGIEFMPLVTEQMYLIGPGKNVGLLPVKAGMKLESLPLVLPNATHGMRLVIDQALGSRSDKLNIAVQVDGFITTKAVVAAGLGYTILPLSAVSHEVASGRLSATRLRRPEIPWTLTLAWNSGRRTIRRVEAVRTVIFEEIRRLGQSRHWPGSAATIHVQKAPAQESTGQR